MMRRLLDGGVVVLLGMGTVAGCSSPTHPTISNTPTPTPTPTQTVANRNPILSGVTVTPSFGVSGLTVFSFAAAGSDLDGDPITYQWAFGSSRLAGAVQTTTVSGDGSVPVVVTALDGRTGSVSETKTVTIGTMTGSWSLIVNNCGAQAQDLPAVMTLTQSGAAVVGSVRYPGPWCDVMAGSTDTLDPGSPSGGGTIDAHGTFEARLKNPDFEDLFLAEGKMDNTGRKITGRAQGSGLGLSTDLFTMTKQ